MTTARNATANTDPDGERKRPMKIHTAAAPLWSIKELSAFLGIPVATLYTWRYHGVGPQAYRCGKHLRYDPAEVRAWLTEQAA